MVALAVALFLFQAADYGAEGTKALEEGKYEAAAEALRKAVAADPADYFAHFNLALAYGFLHRDAEGVAEYRKTLELKPGLYEAQLNGGILLMRLKEPAEALPLLAAASEQKPREFLPLYHLGEAQLQSGAFEQAGDAFRAALELDANSAPAELGLAHALARQGSVAGADPHFRRAVQIDPGLRECLLELAGLYEESRQPAPAMAIYRQFPENPAAQEHLGNLMLENRQYADAIPRLEAAFSRDPTPANRAALAAACVFAGQLDRALPLLDQAVEAEPGNYDLRMMYARALRDSKRYPAAAVQFSDAARLKPSEAMTWNELGGMLYMTGQYQSALSAFDRARDLGENSAGNWFLRAIILDKLKQLKPALAAYQRFLALSQGRNPDQEFQARQRSRIIQRELEKR